jgi:hypothetical protein
MPLKHPVREIGCEDQELGDLGAVKPLTDHAVVSELLVKLPLQLKAANEDVEEAETAGVPRLH